MPLRYLGQAEIERLCSKAPPAKKAGLLADIGRFNALYMIARAGSGHIGSSFSSMEIYSTLYLRRESRNDGSIVFSSKGHDAPAQYSLLTALGVIAFEKLHTLRRHEGLPGHPDISTPGVAANTGSLGMGISKAKGMILANRKAGRHKPVFVITGDGELQEGQIWESLPSAVASKMGELTVIVDYNRLQSDTWVAEVSDLGDLEAKFRAFGWLVERCDGHDPVALGATLDRLANVLDRPKVVIADTVKGKGVSFMEATQLPADGLYRYHSGAPSAEDYERAAGELEKRLRERAREFGENLLRLESPQLPAVEEPGSGPPRVSLITAYSQSLVRLAENDERLVVLDADLVKDTGLLEFRRRFPNRFVECGIAEQDMVSQAGGLALQGCLPFVHSFAAFLTARASEQVYNNATETTKIVYVGSLAGLVPAAPGHSHQALHDIASMAAIPRLVAFEPSCGEELELFMSWLATAPASPYYLRLVTPALPVHYRLPGDYRLSPGRGTVLRYGRDGAFVSAGPLTLNECWKAADRLADEFDLDFAVINHPWLNRFDSLWLAELAERYPILAVVDNHAPFGGLGDRLAGRLALAAERYPVPSLCLFNVDGIPVCGTPAEAMKAHGLDAESLARMVDSFVRRRRIAAELKRAA